MKLDQKTLYEFLHKMQAHIDHNQLEFPEEERRKNFYLFGVCKELIKESNNEAIEQIKYDFYEDNKKGPDGEINRYDDIVAEKLPNLLVKDEEMVQRIVKIKSKQ